MKPSSIFVAVGYPLRFLRSGAGRNVLIATLLSVVLIESMPAVPPRIQSFFAPIVFGLGLEQGHWTMFTPEPDSMNHRVYAIVYYADGSQRTWRPPDWPQQTRWERFVTHRQSKFCESICFPHYLAALPSTADWVVLEVEKEGEKPTAQPVHVEFWMEEAKIPDAHYLPWTSIAERAPFETRWQFGDVDLATKELR